MKKVLTVIALVCFALYLTKIKVEEYGFCIKKFSHISKLYTEQELIDKAILFAMPSNPGTLHFSDGRPPQKLKGYTSLDEFKQFNPNCCKLSDVGPEYYTNPAYVGYVIVTYFTFFERKPYSKNIEGVTEAYIAYDSCGNLYDRYIY